MPIHSGSAASLHVIGDDLDPDEVTRLLGVSPTKAEVKGQRLPAYADKFRIARTGHWRLTVSRRLIADLDGQISELLALTSPDLKHWRSLSDRYVVRVICGLFMIDHNEGIPLSADTLAALADRGAEIDFDIYAPDNDPDGSA